MKKPYTIVPDASTPSSRELADWLAKDGQLLVPLVELLEKGERAIDGHRRDGPCDGRSRPEDERRAGRRSQGAGPPRR